MLDAAITFIQSALAIKREVLQKDVFLHIGLVWYKCWGYDGLDGHSIQRVQSYTAWYRWEPQSQLYSCHALFKEVQLWGASQFLRVNEGQTRPHVILSIRYIAILSGYVHSCTLQYTTQCIIIVGQVIFAWEYVRACHSWSWNYATVTTIRRREQRKIF